MENRTPGPSKGNEEIFFVVDEKLNSNSSAFDLSPGCEKQCVKNNVNSKRAGRAR